MAKGCGALRIASSQCTVQQHQAASRDRLWAAEDAVLATIRVAEGVRGYGWRILEGYIVDEQLGGEGMRKVCKPRAPVGTKGVESA